MEQAADKLALVEKLIQCIAQESDQGIENEKKVTALMEYAIRILSSRLTPPPLATDEYHISQLLQKKSKYNFWCQSRNVSHPSSFTGDWAF